MRSPLPIASCAGWRTVCRCCAMRRRMPCRRSRWTAIASPWVSTIRTGTPCAPRWRCSARGCRPSSPNCWHRASAMPYPARWRCTGVRCRRVARWRRWPRRVSRRRAAPTARCASSRSSVACVRCRMRRARGWTAWCRRCWRPAHVRRSRTPHCVACSRCCRPSFAAPAISRCWTNSPARWAGWSTCWRAARCCPSGWRTTRCCWMNCSTRAYRDPCRIVPSCAASAKPRWSRTIRRPACGC